MDEVEFLVHKDFMNTIMGCRSLFPASLFSFAPRTIAFNITIFRAYTPALDYDNEAVEFFYY